PRGAKDGQVRGPSAEARILGRGELVRLLYRLGRHAASGVLSVATPGSRAELFVLRRGAAIAPDGELARRAVMARLTRRVAHDEVRASFDGGVAAYPPGGANQLSLSGWVRAHLEAQLDNSLAERLVRELAGVRLWIRHEVAPEPRDEA